MGCLGKAPQCHHLRPPWGKENSGGRQLARCVLLRPRHPVDLPREMDAGGRRQCSASAEDPREPRDVPSRARRPASRFDAVGRGREPHFHRRAQVV